MSARVAIDCLWRYISMPQGTPHPTVIPFLKVYIALTAPERAQTRRDSLCYKEAQTHSLCYNFNQKWYKHLQHRKTAVF